MKTNGKATTNLKMKISTELVLEELEDQVQGVVLATMVKSGDYTPKADEAEDDLIQFFNSDPPFSIISLTLPESQVYGIPYAEVRSQLEFADNWLNDDIATTYLSSEEMSIITVQANNGETFGVGAVDRSTAVGMFCTKNWFDQNWLNEIRAATEWNQAMKMAGESQAKLRPIPSYLKEVCAPQSTISEPALKRSENRLHTLLIDMIAVNYQKAFGQPITYLP